MDVIDPVIAALSEVVGRHEGHVDKYAGDALLAYFGAPIAHDDDAHRRSGLRSRCTRRWPGCARRYPTARRATLHIGINTGHAVARVFGSEVRMDYSVLGDAVNLAQRLESRRRPERPTWVNPPAGWGCGGSRSRMPAS